LSGAFPGVGNRAVTGIAGGLDVNEVLHYPRYTIWKTLPEPSRPERANLDNPRGDARSIRVLLHQQFFVPGQLCIALHDSAQSFPLQVP
jgi:hypothetical protein